MDRSEMMVRCRWLLLLAIHRLKEILRDNNTLGERRFRTGIGDHLNDGLCRRC